MINQGEIWLVSFLESVGHEFQKDRPALIIESTEQIKKTNVITIVPLTSNLNNRISDDILITKNNTNNLYSDSIIKTHYIQSFDRKRFIKKIGLSDQTILKQIKEYLTKHFGL